MEQRSPAPWCLLVVPTVACGLVLGACEGGPDPQSIFDGGAPGADAGPRPPETDASFGGTWEDFPDAPILDDAPPPIPGLFSQSPGAPTGGPCLVEPEIGTLFPRNWLRPRFSWKAPAKANVFELRIEAPNQKNALLVYTTKDRWTMPASIWDGLRMHTAGSDLTITIRSAVLVGGTLADLAVGSKGTVGIAPVDAPGSIVYWTTSGGSALKGFRVGDESVVTVLAPPDVKQRPAQCVGCHTGTPDGLYTLSTITPGWSAVAASVEQGKAGDAPPFLAAAGAQAMATRLKGSAATTPAHWGPGDHVALADDDEDLTWVRLDTGENGALARTGDARLACAPSWSHDGSTVVYVSTTEVDDGRPSGKDGDLFSVPWANGQGGAATPVPGASDPAYNEYYPAYSPDDALLAFNRAPAGADAYDQPQAEVFVVPAAGGTPTRLRANDPPACSGAPSPGLTNSWPKWAPAVEAQGGKKYYWAVFSSRRIGGRPQLFVAPVVVDGAKIQSYAALYLWNQPDDESNHTPAWELFKLPPPPPPK